MNERDRGGGKGRAGGTLQYARGNYTLLEGDKSDGYKKNTFFFFFILRRMGKNKALAHHTSAYFHTRRVSI